MGWTLYGLEMTLLLPQTGFNDKRGGEQGTFFLWLWGVAGLNGTPKVTLLSFHFAALGPGFRWQRKCVGVLSPYP